MNNKTTEIASQRLLNKVLQEIAPQLADSCKNIVTPLFTDFNLVPLVVAEVETIEGETTPENIHFVIAVLDRLYVPAQLICKGVIKKPIGLRDAYAAAFKYDNPENINSWADIMAAYYKNPRFADKVDQVAFGVFGNLKDRFGLSASYPSVSNDRLIDNFYTDGAILKMVKNRVESISTHITGAESALLY